MSGSVSLLLQGLECVGKIEDLDNLGSFFPYAREVLTSTALKSVLNSRVSRPFADVQLIGLGLILPVEVDAERSLVFLAYLIPKSLLYPRRFRTCLLMKMLRAAVLCGQAEQLLRTGDLHRRHTEDAAFGQLPLLYLSAHTSDFLSIDPVTVGDARTDAITFYWSGVNKLLAKRFGESHTDLTRAWQLSKAAKDARPAIIEAMALAVFLNRGGSEMVEARAGKKWLTRNGAGLWDLDEAIDEREWPDLYVALERPIRAEHARRIVLKLADKAERIPLKELLDACHVGSIDEIGPTDDGLELIVERDVVTFGRPSHEDAVGE
jgi:hypothetical protein